MSDVWIDRLWMTVGLSLLVAACAGVAWAAIGDRVRGWRAKRAGKAAPRRCGKCWYDMTGVAGLRCPECGHEARDERGLMRSRIRWRRILVSLAVLLPAHVAARMPTVRAHGWARLVPMVVLVSWPMDVGAWADGEPKDWVGKELDDRLESEVLGPVAQRLLSHRVRNALLAEARPEDLVETFPVGDLVRDMRYYVTSAFQPRPPGPMRPQSWSGLGGNHVWQLAECIQGAIHSEGWMANGGVDANWVQVGERLVVRAPGPVIAEIGALLSAMREGEGWIGTFQSEDGDAFRLKHQGPNAIHQGAITVIGLSLSNGPLVRDVEILSEWNELRTTGLLLEQVVNRDSWVRNGGDESSWHVVADRLIIWGPEATRKRCVEILEAIQTSTASHRLVESKDLSIVSLDRLPRAVNGFERGLVVDEDAVKDLRRVVVASVSRDAWSDNGGDGASMLWYRHTLVMGGKPAIRARACEVIDAVLATATDGQPRRCDGSRRYGEDDTDPLGESRLEYVATWKVTGSTLRAWGAKTEQELVAEYGGISLEEVNRNIKGRYREMAVDNRVISAESSSHDAFRALTEHFNNIQPQAWEEDTRCFRFNDVLVLWTTRREMVDHVETALREAEKGPPLAK